MWKKKGMGQRVNLLIYVNSCLSKFTNFRDYGQYHNLKRAPSTPLRKRPLHQTLRNFHWRGLQGLVRGRAERDFDETLTRSIALEKAKEKEVVNSVPFFSRRWNAGSVGTMATNPLSAVRAGAEGMKGDHGIPTQAARVGGQMGEGYQGMGWDDQWGRSIASGSDAPPEPARPLATAASSSGSTPMPASTAETAPAPADDSTTPTIRQRGHNKSCEQH